MDRLMDLETNQWIARIYMHRWMDGWMYGRMDGWMHTNRQPMY